MRVESGFLLSYDKRSGESVSELNPVRRLDLSPNRKDYLITFVADELLHIYHILVNGRYINIVVFNDATRAQEIANCRVLNAKRSEM